MRFVVGRDRLGTLRDAILTPLVRGQLWRPANLPARVFPLLREDSFEAHLRAVATLMGLDPEQSAAPRAAAIPIHLHDLDGDLAVLELWHGPTRSFKDVGVRFAAEAYAEMGLLQSRRVLCATSGDTGAAVAHAFGERATIYFPQGRVSAVQEAQMRTTAARIVEVEGGDFDACQTMVKRAIARGRGLSANSISVARLLPQVAFHAWAALHRPGRVVVVPSGNLGNAYSALLARALGAPIARVHVATNANDGAARAILEGRAEVGAGAAARRTLATAMDVCAPSNWSRLRDLAELEKEKEEEEEEDKEPPLTAARGVLDPEIEAAQRESAYPLCPHTAVGVVAAGRIAEPTIVVGTACASKFA